MNSTSALNHTGSDIFYNALLTIDHISRYYCIIVYLVFILVLILSPAIRTRNLFYVNHATIVSIFYPFVLFAFIFGNTPNFQNLFVNQLLCTMSAYFRDFSNFIRPYSILIIAMYRYLAVFHINIYQRINNSYTLLIAPVVVIWVLSIAVPILVNYILETNVSLMLCLNGSSRSRIISVWYFCISYLIMVIIPSITTILIYTRIMIELKRVRYRVKPNKTARVRSLPIVIHVTPRMGASISDDSANVQSAGSLVMDSHKERTFALHFILMGVSVILTSAVFSVFYQNRILPNYFTVLHYWLPILRVFVSIGISLVPITSLYFHPSRAHIYRNIKEHFFG